MTTLLNRLFGDPNLKELKKLQPLVAAINAREAELEQRSDTELRDQFGHLRQRVATAPAGEQPKLLTEVLVDVFAHVREMSKRTLGLRHFDEQLIGGIVLHQGKIAEMKTGEGKTLVATLPLSLNALAGRGAHLVTPNDYLAKVGTQTMGPLYYALGLSVGVIGQQGNSWRYQPQDGRRETVDEAQPSVERLASSVSSDWPELVPCTRAEAYRADITYGTNNEFGFDYLRDNMVLSPTQLAQRELHYAIVDEVDSILIDEARTPLIISAAAEESADLYAKFATFVSRLKAGDDYTVDEKERHVSMTEQGIGKMEQVLGVTNIYEAKTVQFVHHLEEAVRAQALYQRDRDYVVKDGEVIIVDEFTGRLMPGRRYSEGLHQAIEAKEGVEVKQESRTMATITFQNLFRMYDKLAGMTGTAATEAEEFAKIYNLDVVDIPTHRPVVRIDHEDIIYKTEAAKFAAIAEDVKRRVANNQPVLVGTVSIEKSERLAKLLKKSGVKHEVLNAKQHEREAKIIELAGEPSRVTVATNMAGRGVDILLGGKKPGPTSTKKDIEAWEKRHQQVLKAGGLAVIGTERHEARRIDNQLRGRSGRQGDPGESQFYVSTEDDLMRIFGGDRLRGMMDRLGLPDDEPIKHKLVTGSLEQAQKRVEGHNFDTRKHLVEYDDVMNQHREVVYRKRRKILELNPATETWLHDEIVDLMHEDELETFTAKMQTVGEAQFRAIERLVYLRTIDTLWVQHLMTMQHLREGIGLKGYAQRDPLVEYKDAAFQQFQDLKDDIENQVAEMLLKLELKQAPTSVTAEPSPPQNLQLKGADESLAGGAVHADETEDARRKTLGESPALSPTPTAPLGAPSGIQVVVRRPGTQPEQRGAAAVSASNPYAGVGRNDQCPCGSGKKFKKCHGA
ncbi:preprotein translocase subunit SecA [Candidatus Berkelbacteria bacterium]|nr:preprotein translocase subunit SecA [Candidatus Berkelbacteria bacterium]